MRLTTPPAIRTLQRKLYVKAKTEPTYRFYRLYDKVYRGDILAHAYALAKANRGEPGVDGVTFEEVESMGLTDWSGQRWSGTASAQALAHSAGRGARR